MHIIHENDTETKLNGIANFIRGTGSNTFVIYTALDIKYLIRKL